MLPSVSRDAAAAVDWARRTVSDPHILYLDTETTGLGGGAEIVDIAVINARGRVMLDALVRPRRPIPPDSTQIHGITNAMVATAPRWDEIAPRLDRLLAAASGVVIYNAEFDAGIIEACNVRHGLPPYRANWQCAMKQYAAFAGQRHPRYGDYRWHRLSVAAARFGVRGQVEHRALADTRLCRTVVVGMAGG